MTFAGSLFVHHCANDGHFHGIGIVNGRGNWFLHAIRHSSLDHEGHGALHSHRLDLLHRYLDLLQLRHGDCLGHGHSNGNRLGYGRDHGTRHTQLHWLLVGHMLLLVVCHWHMLGDLDVLGQRQPGQCFAALRRMVHTRCDWGQECIMCRLHQA